MWRLPLLHPSSSGLGGQQRRGQGQQDGLLLLGRQRHTAQELKSPADAPLPEPPPHLARAEAQSRREPGAGPRPQVGVWPEGW
eukprot:3788440-Lingulodinium_polyedra.AAC.1